MIAPLIRVPDQEILDTMPWILERQYCEYGGDGLSLVYAARKTWWNADVQWQGRNLDGYDPNAEEPWWSSDETGRRRYEQMLDAFKVYEREGYIKIKYPKNERSSLHYYSTNDALKWYNDIDVTFTNKGLKYIKYFYTWAILTTLYHCQQSDGTIYLDRVWEDADGYVDDERPWARMLPCDEQVAIQLQHWTNSTRNNQILEVVDSDKNDNITSVRFSKHFWEVVHHHLRGNKKETRAQMIKLLETKIEYHHFTHLGQRVYNILDTLLEDRELSDQRGKLVVNAETVNNVVSGNVVSGNVSGNVTGSTNTSTTFTWNKRTTAGVIATLAALATILGFVFDLFPW